MMPVMDLPEMTWEYCVGKAFEAMHCNWSAEMQQTKAAAWLAIAREIRKSEAVTTAAVQKIVSEAKPV